MSIFFTRFTDFITCMAIFFSVLVVLKECHLFAGKILSVFVYLRFLLEITFTSIYIIYFTILNSRTYQTSVFNRIKYAGFETRCLVY